VATIFADRRRRTAPDLDCSTTIPFPLRAVFAHYG
jgi:hypothetical protein